MYKANLQIRSYSRRVRTSGGRVSRGSVPRRCRRHLPPRRLPLLPHPRAAAAGPSPPLTCLLGPSTPPPHPLTSTSHPTPPHFSSSIPSSTSTYPQHPYRSRLWHTQERQVRPDCTVAPVAEVVMF